MRVSDSYKFQSFQTNISSVKEQLQKIATMISSQKKILSPSDDPAGTSEYMQFQAQTDTNSQYIKNLQQLSTLGGTYETAANSVTDILTSAKQLATTMASASFMFC